MDGAEIEDAHEILMAEIALRLQSAAGHHSVGGTDKGGVLELLFDIVFIVFLQHASVNDTENILLVLVPISLRKQGGYQFDLHGKSMLAGSAVAGFQRRRHVRLMLRTVLP